MGCAAKSRYLPIFLDSRALNPIFRRVSRTMRMGTVRKGHVRKGQTLLLRKGQTLLLVGIFLSLRKGQTLLLVGIFLSLLVGGIGSVSAVDWQLGEEIYQIEIARTPVRRQQGLMHRSHLGPRQGMLLVYSQAGDHRIWMKNVLIPLRVYWIDARFEVIKVQRLEPCRADPCPVYAASRDSQYVLELAADYDHSLAAGDKIEALRSD